VDTIEANACLVHRNDGWRIQFVFDDGQIAEQTNPPFATREEAQRALDLWQDENAVSVLKPQ
jgi:hypothetical protein